MAIVDSKEGASRPLLHLLELWLDDVEDNAHSVLVVVPHNSLVSVCRITAYHSILLAGKLGWVIWIDKPVNLLLLHLHVLLLLLSCHNEAPVGNQLILGFRLGHPTWIVAPLLLLGALLLLNLVMVGAWWLGVTWFLFPLIARLTWFLLLWSLSCLVLILLVCVRAGVWLVSHPWACSQSIDSSLGWIGPWTLIKRSSSEGSSVGILLDSLSEVVRICSLVIGIAVVFNQLLLLLHKQSLGRIRVLTRILALQ